jgi:hypothetical protein
MGRCARVILSGRFLLFAASATAQTVKVNWQTTAPFADHRTCVWRPGKNPPIARPRQAGHHRTHY